MSAVEVALVRPRDLGAVPAGAPVQDALGVGYLASSLRRAGRSVVIVDAHALGLDDDGLVACLTALAPAIVGLSLHAFSDFQHSVAISRGLGALPDRPLCIWGGEHATFFAHRILAEHPDVDGVVLGEGELTFAEIVAQQCGGAGTVPGGWSGGAVEGAVLRSRDGRILDGGYRHAISELDQIPCPDKDIVEMALARGQPVTLSLMTGRGCYHRCRFCTAHEFMRLGGGEVWRRRTPQAVVDELSSLTSRFVGHPLVHPIIQFQDVIFLGTSRAARRWIEEFLDELEGRELVVPFYCMTRADSIIANEDLLPRLVRAGLRSVEVGIESGIDRVLQSYNKRNSAAENEKAVAILRANGVAYDASGFIMFDPYMTLDELRSNALYLARFGAATWDFFVTRLQLYPGTELREEMIRKGLTAADGPMDQMAIYQFTDPRVAAVADAAYYYHPRIRTLDLKLRDAKAIAAAHVRAGHAVPDSVRMAIDVVHGTYCQHLIDLIGAAERDRLSEESPALIGRFLGRVDRLLAVMTDVCASTGQASVPAAA